ncbi:MAG: ATP-grasp domain-containing protein [Patescibacteria group bacterium]
MSDHAQSKKLRVGVLRGGPSGEYEISLKTGKNIIDALQGRSDYEIQDIFVDRNGVWHVGGVSRPAERVLPYVDVIVNALHGAYGEDGRVQQLLESHNVPYTGSRPLGSALGMNKPLAKKFFKMRGLLTPEHTVIKKDNYSPEILRKIMTDYPHLRLVKPASSGSSLGVSVVNNHAEFEEAMERAFEHSDSVMVEEYLRGREATCGVVEGSSGQEVYALHPIEIRVLSCDPLPDAENSVENNRNRIWSYESKYRDDLHELICPGNFTVDETRLIQQSAVNAHKALGLRHYSRSDFILNRLGVYILEVNTLPGLTPMSLFPRALSVAGFSLGEFLDHIITLAVEKN